MENNLFFFVLYTFVSVFMFCYNFMLGILEAHLLHECEYCLHTRPPAPHVAGGKACNSKPRNDTMSPN